MNQGSQNILSKLTHNRTYSEKEMRMDLPLSKKQFLKSVYCRMNNQKVSETEPVV